MQRIDHRIWAGVLIIALVSLSCQLFAALPSEAPPVAVQPTPKPANQVEPPPAQPSADEPGFGPIIFCQDVTDQGQPINPMNSFPQGTRLVYALFTFWGMEPGMTWGHYWTQDGYEYIDGTGEAWDEETEGWVAYYIEENDALTGEFTLTLYIGDQPVQEGSFSIAEGSLAYSDGSGSFGSIQFAEDITDELVPIGPATAFEGEVIEVYAVFPYFYMTDGQNWSREWVYEGEVQVYTDLTWDEGTEGLTYASFGYEGDEAFPPGTYTLNLYIDDQLARSASFEVIGEEAHVEPDVPQGPAAPEDIIDPNLMQAWEILYYANPDILNDVAQFALDYHIEMILSDEVSSKGVYRCSQGSDEPGTLYIGLTFWSNASWEEVAATMAHELTHAVQHLEGGRCYCSIENEYYAYITEFYVLQETGRMDLLESKWRGAYDEDGRFDGDKLWAAVKDAYPECPDY
jgi:hypothetical protein